MIVKAFLPRVWSWLEKEKFNDTNTNSQNLAPFTFYYILIRNDAVSLYLLFIRSCWRP